MADPLDVGAQDASARRTRATDESPPPPDDAAVDAAETLDASDDTHDAAGGCPSEVPAVGDPCAGPCDYGEVTCCGAVLPQVSCTCEPLGFVCVAPDCDGCCGDGTCWTGGGEDCGSCPADCGECPTLCGDGQCAPSEDCDGCPGDCGCADGEVCNAGECCAPDCAGKTCGPDGCGQTCGECSTFNHSCVDGLCAPLVTQCGDTSGYLPGAAWPMEDYCPGRHGRSPHAGPEPPYAVACSNENIDAKIRSGPVLGTDGLVYFQATGMGNQSAVRALRWDGSTFVAEWAYTLTQSEASSSTPVLRFDGVVVAASADGRVYAVSPQGEPKWITDVEGEVSAPLTLAGDGRVLVASSTRLTALSAAGETLWTLAPGAGADKLLAPAATAGGWMFGYDSGDWVFALTDDAGAGNADLVSVSGTPLGRAAAGHNNSAAAFVATTSRLYVGKAPFGLAPAPDLIIGPAGATGPIGKPVGVPAVVEPTGDGGSTDVIVPLASGTFPRLCRVLLDGGTVNDHPLCFNIPGSLAGPRSLIDTNGIVYLLFVAPSDWLSLLRADTADDPEASLDTHAVPLPSKVLGPPSMGSDGGIYLRSGGDLCRIHHEGGSP